MNVLFSSTASCLILSKAWISIYSAQGPFPKDDVVKNNIIPLHSGEKLAQFI